MGNMRDLQVAAARALVRLYQGDTAAAIQQLSRFELTFDQDEPILLPRHPSPVGGVDPAWAVGIEHLAGEFGMVAGPYPTKEEVLGYVPATEEARIIFFPPGFGKDPDAKERVTHQWCAAQRCWREVKP